MLSCFDHNHNRNSAMNYWYLLNAGTGTERSSQHLS